MPLNKLENFIKNTEGRIIYVNPSDLDATDSISNQGNSLTKPFKSIQRALLESSRFSYLRGNNNDITEKTTILLFPGEYIIDNRPGYAIKDQSGTAIAVSPSGEQSSAIETLSLTLESKFDLTQSDNILYKFNSINGGVVVPRGTSIVSFDLRKTKIRAKYVPNPTDPAVNKTAIFRITGACYFWQMSFFDSDESGLVYTDPSDFSSNNQSKPTFSHHKLTCFEYADGVTKLPQYSNLTDLDIYYSKVSNAFNPESGRDIDQKYPDSSEGFAKQRPEWEIVGAFANDPIAISSIISGDGFVPESLVTVTTAEEHELTSGTPIKIRGISVEDYNISTKVQNVLSPTTFTYLLPSVRDNLPASPATTNNQVVVVETDTVSGASPYVFNCSLRSVWGMNGMWADGAKASGFRSMVVAQFTGVSLQKDDRAFVKYDKSSRTYGGITISKQTGSTLSSSSSSLNPAQVYHLDSDAIYRNGWEPSHIKISNDAFIQIVSVFAIGFNKHFDVESGGDASITNSNSNFGQISLTADGFKRNAFDKDDHAYITSIITPKSVTTDEIDVDWISLDVGLTTSVGISSHLYLFGFNAQDDKPPVIVQGYRIGARRNDLLYVNSGATAYSANILMVDGFTGNISRGTNSSEKEYRVTSGPTNNVLTLSSTHGLQNGEKIRIFSEDGDLPENIDPNIVYYAITNGVASNQIKIAASKTNADSGVAINIYVGTNLKIISRVSDKTSGELGFPVQFDSTNSNWYIHVNPNNEIYNNFSSQGVSVLGERSSVSYFKRFEDPRGLEDKLYKVRVVVPQTAINAKDPSSSFIIQESSSTGIGSTGYANNFTITLSDYEYNRNPRFLTSCSVVGSAVSAVCDRSHNLNTNDVVIIKDVKSTNNLTGEDNLGYNGIFRVSEVVNDKVFKYGNSLTDILGIVHNPGTFTSGINTRDASLPRFERNDLQNNYFIYRNDVITPYVFGVQDGIYHLTVLNAKNNIPTEFTNLKYSQNVVDLYPQFDKDNINENPRSAVSFAKRSPLGEVITNDLQKSITRETVDSLISTFGAGLKISGVTTSFTTATTGVATITFDREHGFAGIITYNSLTGGSDHTPGTFYNVKLFNNVGKTIWGGATAKVIVSAATSSVSSVEIISGGSGYTPGTLYIDNAQIGASVDASIVVPSSGISSAIGDSVQITGIGLTSDGYYRITSVPSSTQVAIAITNFDPKPIANQYAFNIGPSLVISGATVYNTQVGIRTFTTTIPHGLVAGNSFRILNATGGSLGDYLVREKVSNTSFSAVTPAISGSSYVIKHAFSTNNGISDSSDENLSIRGVYIYDKEILTLQQNITTENDFQVSLPFSGIGTVGRFPLGAYIQVDDEIMRVSRNGLTGASNNRLNVLRGALGTQTQNHSTGSLIRKIKVLPVEFRRPSISRASGHTFEYLGYGPGNYSTGLPQIQVKTLTEREDFLVQSQERSGGTVVYTGMNSDGDFFIGNTKYSSSSGTQKTFDIPTPTVTAEDPSRSSVIFDEIRVKERLLVEGGNSGTVLSQFDGPVTFNNEIKVNNLTTLTGQLKVVNQTESTAYDTGAVIINGGLGVGKKLNVLGNVDFSGTLNVEGETTIDDTLTSTGITRVTNTTNSTSTSTGSVVISGGLGIAENLYAGGSIRFTSTTNSTSTSTGSVVLSGGIGIAGNLYVGGSIRFTSTTSSTSTSTGSVVLSGGLGIAENLYAGGVIRFTNTTGSTSPSTGSVVISGGLGIAENLYVGGSVRFTNITDSTSSSTGSVVISGGLGITKNLYVGETIYGNLSGNATSSTLSSSSAQIQTTSRDADANHFITFVDSNNSTATSEILYTDAGVRYNPSSNELLISGDITAFASDERLKTNIKPLENALDKVLSLEGFTYNFNEIGEKLGFNTKNVHVGVSAQQVQSVLPEAVCSAPSDDNYLTVKYEKIVPLLIEAIKELTEKVNSLEDKLKTISNK
jgi:hypothetical protein